MSIPLIQELKSSLASSTGQQRAEWGKIIVVESIAIEDLLELLDEDNKTAKRFLWLLSNVGMWDRNYLKNALHKLLELSDNYDHLEMKSSMVSYWCKVGIPVESESKALNLLFSILNSTESNVTTKSRAIWALEPLIEKYTDLKPELKSILEFELGKYGKDYDKRVMKVLEKF
jgi:hypothetical protein